MFLSLEPMQTSAFEYPRRGMNPPHLCLLTSAPLLGIIFILPTV